MIGVPLVVKIIFDKTIVLRVPTASYDYKNILKHKNIRFTPLPLATGGKMCHAPTMAHIRHVPGPFYTV